jgi:hypothetical protein
MPHLDLYLSNRPLSHTLKRSLNRNDLKRSFSPKDVRTSVLRSELPIRAPNLTP